METRTDLFLRETADVLEQNILNYWLSLQDSAGGFYGEVLSDGTVLPDAPRGVILNARIMWAFAAAYRQLGRPEYLAAAVAAKAFSILCLPGSGTTNFTSSAWWRT